MSRQCKPRRVLSSNDVATLRLQLAMAEHQKRAGERLRQARKERGWTQAELARHMPPPVDAASVGRYERGAVMPGPERLEEFGRVLGKDPSYFLIPDPPDGAPADLMGALSPLGRDDLARRIEEVAEAVAKLVEAQAAAAALAEQDRALLREVAEAVLQERRRAQ